MYYRLVRYMRIDVLSLYTNTEERLSKNIYDRDFSKINFLPIDRGYLLPYIEGIRQCDAKKFIAINLIIYPESYVHRLLVCLPELFADLRYEDLMSIMENLKDPKAVLSLSVFLKTYIPCVEVNSLLDQAITNSVLFEMVSKKLKYYNRIKAPSMEDTLIIRSKVGIDLNQFHVAVQHLCV